MALRNLLVRVGADISPMQNGFKKAQKDLNNFGSVLKGGIAGTVGKVAGLLATIGAGFTLKDGIQDAMQFESAMGTIQQTLGSSAKDFEKWQGSVGTSLGFSRLESAKLANTLSLNFKGIASSQQDLFEKTTTMMKTASIIASKRGMSMQEVSDRIRSAMNQEADGADELGVNVRVSAIQQSEAYKKMADGRPWAELNQYQQKTILYNHILEQTSANLGNTVADNTLTRFNAFKASLLDVRMALGSVFIPILAKVLPYLTAFAQRVYQALMVVATFMKALFGYKGEGKSQQKQTIAQTNAIGGQTKAVDGLGKSLKKTAKAGKEASKGVAGFDEINALNDSKAGGGDTGAGGGGGGGAIGGGALPTMDTGANPFEAIGNSIGKVSEKIKAFAEKVRAFFKPIGEVIKEVWNVIKDYFIEKFQGIAEFWKENGKQFGQAWKNVWKVIKPIAKFIVEVIWNDIKGAIDGLIRFVEGLIEIFTGVFTGDWKKVWEGCKDTILGALQAIWHIISLFFMEEFMGVFKLFGKIFGKWGDDLWKGTKGIWENLLLDIKGMMLKVFTDIWDGIKGIFGVMWDWFKTEVVDKFILGWTKTDFKIIGTTIWDGITGAFKTISTWFKTNVGDKITGSLEYLSSLGATIWGYIKNFGGSVWEWVKANVVDKFTGSLASLASLGKTIWGYIKNFGSSVWDWVASNVRDKFTSALSGLKNLGSTIWGYIKSGWGSVSSWFTTNIVSPIKKAFNNMTSGIKDTFVSGFKTVFNKGASGINTAIGWLNKMIDKLNDLPMISGIPKIGFKVPYLAEGGIATRATLAMVGEGSQAEAIAPLDKLQSMITTAVTTAMSFNRAGAVGSNQTVVLNIDGRQLARVALPYLQNESLRTGVNIKLNQI